MPRNTPSMSSDRKSSSRNTPLRSRASRRFRRSRHVWLSRSLWNRRLVFLVGSVTVGLAAIVFAIAATRANLLLHAILYRWPWAPLILAPGGFALVSFLSRRFFRGAEGSGIPQTIATLNHTQPELRDRLLSMRVAIGKILMTLTGLVSGASIGREGPTVHVGAALMYTLSKFSSFPLESMKRGLILAGGAAGIAAAFNAPLAGVVFAIEEMSRSFEQRTSGIVITAVIVAGIVSLALLGNYAYFGHTDATLAFGPAIAAVLMCGVGGGIAGGAFSRVLIASSVGFSGKLGVWRKTRPHLFAAGCGLALAVFGYLSGSTIYGTGYAETRQILEGSTSIPQSFGILKLFASVVSYVSGVPGGLFSPSLAVGAGFGQNVALLLPGAPVAAVVVLGMVGYFAGVVQAPITAFVIVIEMTRDSEMALPLMAAALIAHGMSRLICPRPLYKTLAKAFKPAPTTSTTSPS